MGDLKLDGKIVWIIGGSGGIGSVIARACAREGADVAIGYCLSKEKALGVASEIEHEKQRTIRTVVVHCDSQKRSSIAQAYHEVVEKLGYPSILIYAAGIAQAALFQDYTEFDVNKMIDIHLKGAIHSAQIALPFFLQQKGGRIIFISSIWGEVGGAYEVLYSSVKGAQNALARSLAKELAPSGITVNAVSPGAIRSEMLQEQLNDVDQEYLMEKIPAGRFGEPREVASLVCYLCSEDASYITGQVLHINGGWNG